MNSVPKSQSVDEYDIKMPFGIRHKAYNKHRKQEKESIQENYGETKLCLKWHRTEQEWK
jgi:hypothetical protein